MGNSILLFLPALALLCSGNDQQGALCSHTASSQGLCAAGFPRSFATWASLNLQRLAPGCRDAGGLICFLPGPEHLDETTVERAQGSALRGVFPD